MSIYTVVTRWSATNKVLIKILLLRYQLNSDQITQKNRAKHALSIGKKEIFLDLYLRKKSTSVTTFGMP